jgi:2-(1,2-epoxy-1,2-dihydrophenyl)acetyl-CoA isomerase
MKAALEVAARIAVNPTYAVRMTKRLMREGQDFRLESLLELSAAM